MREDKYISDAEYEAALAEPIALVDESDLNHLASPYFVEHVRQLATKRYGNTELFKGGLRFYSTLDTRMQAAAEGALRKGLESLDRRLGFRGPIGSGRRQAARRVDRRPGTSAVRRDRRHQRARRSAAARAALRRDDRRADEERRRRSSTSAPSGCRSSTRTPRTSARGIRRQGRHDRLRQAGRARRLLARAPRRADGTTATHRAAPCPARLARSRSSRAPAASSRSSAATTGPRRSSIARPRRTARSARRSSRSSTRRRSRPARRPSTSCTTARSRCTTATGMWTPANYDNKYMGDVTLMTALAYSLNTISVQIAVAGRPRSHDRDHARLRHHVADPAPHLDRARHARHHAARDRGRLRRHRERRPPRHAAVLRSRHRTPAATSSRICATRRRARRSSRPRSPT